MATQIFELGIYQAADKDVLSKEEAIAYCAGYGQQGNEIKDFFATHDFDKWRCVQMDVYDQYSANNDPDGHLDCSPPALLGILLTSMDTEEPEQALRKYSKPGIDINYPYQDDGDVQLNLFPTCPLWICGIKNWEKYSLNAVVLLPEAFWHENGPSTDSYGYPYTVKYPGSRNHWYWGGRDKTFYHQRMGAFSANVLETDGRAIPRNFDMSHYDPTHHRMFMAPIYGGEIKYYDLKGDLDPQTVDIADVRGMAIKDDVYRFYSKKAVVITDKEFGNQQKMTSKTGLPKGNQGMQEFAADGWDVMVTQNGIGIKSPTAETVTKLSDFKLNTQSSAAFHSMMTVDAQKRLVIVGGQVVLVNPDLSIQNIPLKKAFKKALKPVLGDYFVYKDSNTAHGVLTWSPDQQWFFLNSFVFTLNEKDEPVLLNERLQALCGEFIYRGAVYDASLDGAWLLAGMERLVFLPRSMDKAYLFNVAVDSPSTEVDHPYLGFDKDENLWFGQAQQGKIRCIARTELEAKLKTASPFQQ